MEPADLNYSNWICVNQYQIIPPPRQYPDSFRQPKTTPRNLPDTLKTPKNRKLNGQSRVNIGWGYNVILIILIGFMSINITLYPHPIFIDWGCLECVWGCLKGVRRVSGWLWILHGWLSCQINCWNSNEGTLSIVLIGWFPFSRWPWNGYWVSCFGVSVGCL